MRENIYIIFIDVNKIQSIKIELNDLFGINRAYVFQDITNLISSLYNRSATPPTLHFTHILTGLQTYGLLIRPAKTSSAGTLRMPRNFLGKFYKNVGKPEKKLLQ
jgi:hypothetical protein